MLTRMLWQVAESSRKTVKPEFADGLHIEQRMAFRNKIGFLDSLSRTIRTNRPAIRPVRGKTKTGYFIAQTWRAGKEGVAYVSSPAFSFNVVNKEACTAAELLFGTPVALNETGRYSNTDNTIEVCVQLYD